MLRLIIHGLCLVLTLTLAAAPSFAVEPDGRPTVGLVLGGGAAKGLSHVGIIKVLEDNQIPVDVIAGTSIGGVVGSLYAAGYSAAEIETIATELDWNEIFVDDSDRSRAQFRRKSDDFGFLTDFKLAFNNGKLVLPAGLIEGQSLYLELSRLLTRTYAAENFDDLVRPLRVVSTNLSNGQPVVMEEGNLVSAVFGSMAIPGFIPPVERDGIIMVDGAFSNNLPMNVARDMGADVLIVIDLGTDPRPAEELENVVDVIRQLQILLTIGNSNLQRATIQPDDIYIDPDLKDISITGFDKVDVTITRGKEAAVKALPKLQSLRLDDAAWQRYLDAHRVRKNDMPVIDRIVIDQDTNLSDKILRAGLSVQAGDQLDVNRLNADINKLYDDGVFDRIKYELVEVDGETVLQVSASAKESADGYFRFGVSLDSNLQDESSFRLGVAYTKPQINRWGAELRAEVIIGDRTDALAEFYQPIGAKQDFFIEPSIQLSRRNDDFFDAEARRRGELEATLYGGEIAAGTLFGRWGELRGGVRRSFGDVTFSDNSLNMSRLDIDDGSIFGRFTVDTLDDLAFPTKGEIFIAEYAFHDEALGGTADYDEYRIEGLKPFNFDRHTLLLGGRFTGSRGPDANILGTANLGGFLSLSGFGEDELVGRYSALGLGSYYYRLNQEAPLFDAPVFIGVSAEAGNVYQSFDKISLGDVVYGGSVFAGVDSPIGPVFLGFGYNDEGRQSVYFSIGGFF